MADPGKQSEFSPEELDRLEDALERWTGLDEPVPEDSSLAPLLRARLADYRGLLALTRDALPMVDVPDTLLAGVLAEAHAVAAPTAPAVHRRERSSAGPSLWERLRRSMLLPGVALAGSAALLLWVVQPAGEADSDLMFTRGEPRASAPTPARLAPDASPAPAAPEVPAVEEREVAADALRARSDAALGGAAMAPPAAPGAAAALDAPAQDVPKGMSEKPDAKKAKKSEEARAEPVEAYPGLDDSPMAEAGADKEALRDSLELADGARRKGRCSEALGLYREAMTMGGPNSERARARAGYGLCLATQGDDDRADKYFAAARKLSPSIDAWIARERGDSPTRKSSAKPSAKSRAEMSTD